MKKPTKRVKDRIVVAMNSLELQWVCDGLLDAEVRLLNDNAPIEQQRLVEALRHRFQDEHFKQYGSKLPLVPPRGPNGEEL